MHIQENTSLLRYNTFHIQAFARYFLEVHSVEEIQEALLANPAKDRPVLILGGGSNLLFTGNYDGLVIRNGITGIAVVKEEAEQVFVQVGAGENWHRFVLYCIGNNLAGVENLSLIPGSTGASPIQNIGAYGVEVKDVFHSLEAWHMHEHKLVTFYAQDCAFGYRDSVFKNKYKGQFVIVNVTFRLSRKPHYNTSYGALQQELEKAGVQHLSIRAISEAVIRIRQSKLPDPALTGNAGSFFKNPEVTVSHYQLLKKEFEPMPGFPTGEDSIKLAAGWLIEQCGWKGYRRGDAGCYEKQALVLVNYGGASGKDVYDLSDRIVESVREKFGIGLEREVNIL